MKRQCWKNKAIVLGLGLMLFSGSAAQAATAPVDQMQALANTLKQLQDQTAALQKQMDALRKQMADTAASNAVVVATCANLQTGTNAPASTVPASWADKVKIYGDIRYRVETRLNDNKANANPPYGNVEYDRLRARLGAIAQVNDNVTVNLRLTTDDPYQNAINNSANSGQSYSGVQNSGNADLGNGFSKKLLFLDVASIDWNLFGPNKDELHVIAGKMENPFYTSPVDDLVWSSNITPEGIALKGKVELGSVKLFGSAGYFVVENQDTGNTASLTNASDSVTLYALQGGATVQVVKDLSVTAGLSYYGFYGMNGFYVPESDPQGGTSTGGAFGNTTTTGTAGGAYNCNFDVYMPFIQVDTALYGIPLALFTEAVDNSGSQHMNQGSLYGITVGKAKKPNSLEVGFDYARLAADSTLGMMTDSDRWGGGTDGSGYQMYVKYQIFKNLAVQTKFMDDRLNVSGNAGANEPGGSGYKRWQFDLLASF